MHKAVSLVVFSKMMPWDSVYNKVPHPTSQQLDKLLQRATEHAHKNGVTQVHDMGSYGGWIDLETYRRAYANQTLGIRIYSFVSLSTWQKMADFVKQNGKEMTCCAGEV